MLKTTKLILAGTSALIAGCASLTSYSSEITSRSVVEDVLRTNQAYADATNAVILANILRARDRWPRTFTTLSEINSSPKSTLGVGPSLNPRDNSTLLGTLPYGLTPGQLSVGGENLKTYKISPLTEKSNPEGLLRRLDSSTYERYASDWPSDLAFLIFVKRLETTDGEVIATNAGDNFYSFQCQLADYYGRLPAHLRGREKRADCDHLSRMLEANPHDPALQFNPISYSDLVFDIPASQKIKRDKKGHCSSEDISLQRVMSKNSSGETKLEQLKELDEHGRASIAVSSAGGSNVKISVCDAAPRKVFTHSIYSRQDLKPVFRSFEDIIYYLGETQRTRGTAPHVKVPCGGGGYGPVFKTVSSPAPGMRYGAVATHAGQTWYAMDAWENPCDRTATVMSLLTELLLLNQSAEFLKAPDILLR